MKKFNNGKPFHGSTAVEDGKLKGATGRTDYFFFFCPNCPDKYIMRILDYCAIQDTPENRVNSEMKIPAAKGFILAFKLYCEKCKHTDFVKIDNVGLQGGFYKDAIST